MFCGKIKKLSFFAMIGLLAMLFAPQAMADAQKIYVANLDNVHTLSAQQRYDIYHAVACIQGLANRTAPRLFAKYWTSAEQQAYWGFGVGDEAWLSRLTESGGLCEGWTVYPDVTINAVADIGPLVDTFRGNINGVIAYDDDAINGVRSTSLAATTAAGVLGGIAVRKDTTTGSMYNYLTATKGLPVLVDLDGKFTGSGNIWDTNPAIPSTGSKKNDAYLWAKQKFLDSGLCDPTVLSYTLDLWSLKYELQYDLSPDQRVQLSNLDYAISKKGFCFDLCPWGNETPVDDPTQPLGTDLNTFRSILDTCNTITGQSKMIKFGGFPNWDIKYTYFGCPGYPCPTNPECAPYCCGGTHGPVDTEWETARIVSGYNAYLEAEFDAANASFYAALAPFAAQRRYVQNPTPTYTSLQSQGIIDGSGNVVPDNYILLGMGDYDGLDWPLYLVGDLFNDTVGGQRNSINCSWAIDPQLTDKGSVAFDYYYRHLHPKDFFMSWDSGCGYVNPSELYDNRYYSGYPSIVSVWQELCKKYYRMYDYSISGWLLDGFARNITTTDYQNYAPFSGDGIGAHPDQSPPPPDDILVAGNVPCDVLVDGGHGPGEAGSMVIPYEGGVRFKEYRTILWSPTDIKTLQDRYPSYKFLDAYTYFYLFRYYLSSQQQSSNYYRATWIGDTIPKVMTPGQTYYNITVTVRNDGWDTWTTTAPYELSYEFRQSGAYPYSDTRVTLPSNVAPGGQVTFTFNITAPTTAGTWNLYYDMVNEGAGTFFCWQNNLEWKTSILVANVVEIDNQDPPGGGYSDTAGFTYATSEGYLGDVDYCAAGAGANNATFTPTISTAGMYKVFTRWTADTVYHASNAPYTIHDTDAGTTDDTFACDQRYEGDAWVYLGTYSLAVGTGGYVRVTDNANNSVIADAVKFEQTLVEFADIFPSATFDSTKWTNSGTVSTNNATYRYKGYSARFQATSAGVQDSLTTKTTAFNTTGKKNIQVSFVYKTVGCEAWDKFLIQYSKDGTTFINAGAIVGNSTVWKPYLITLPEDAAGQANFKVRFTTDFKNDTTDNACLDEVEILYDVIVPESVPDVTVTFINCTSDGAYIDGWQDNPSPNGIDFGYHQWLGWESAFYGLAGPGKCALMTDNSTHVVRTINLPPGKKLKKVDLGKCGTPEGTITLSSPDNPGQDRTVSIASCPVINYLLNWSNPSPTVTITVDITNGKCVGSVIGFDNFVFGD